MKRLFFLLIAGSSSYLHSGPLDLSNPYTGNFVENFDSMGSGGTSVPGTVGANAPWSVIADTQRFSSLTPINLATDPDPSHNAFNVGIDGDGDRALGIYRGGPNDDGAIIGRFTNATGATLNQFELRFDVELLYIEDQPGVRWGGMQASISTDNLTYTDLGNAFEGTIASSAVNNTNEWLSDDIPQNNNRNIGGIVDVAALLGGGIAQGADFYLKFDLKNNVSTPAGLGDGNNKRTAVFLDNVRLFEFDQGEIPEPSTYLIMLTFLLIVMRTKKQVKV